MSKKLIRAAGAVVLRPGGKEPEVLVVHQTSYGQWTLPKGKIDGNESPPAAAVREVFEETGVRIRLATPLDRVKYQTDRGPKHVDWWLGIAVDPKADIDLTGVDADEVSDVAWWSVKKARKELAHDTDRDLVQQALAEPVTTPLLIVRHGKAIDRKHWKSDDASRPLAARGQEQSDELVGFFAAYGVERISTSPWARCVQTVTPYASQTQRVIEPIEAINEDAFESSPEGAALATVAVAEKAAAGTPTLVCGHRPVLPTIFAAIDVPDRSLEPGATVIAHLTADGAVHAIEEHSTDA